MHKNRKVKKIYYYFIIIIIIKIEGTFSNTLSFVLLHLTPLSLEFQICWCLCHADQQSRWPRLKCSGLRNATRVTVWPRARRAAGKSTLLTPQSSSRAKLSLESAPQRGTELLISAANAEVTDGFCTLGKRREAGEWEEGGSPEELLDDVQRGVGLISKSPRSIHPPRGLLCKEAVNLSAEQGRPGGPYGVSPSWPQSASSSVPGL